MRLESSKIFYISSSDQIIKMCLMILQKNNVLISHGDYIKLRGGLECVKVKCKKTGAEIRAILSKKISKKKFKLSV